MTKPRGFMYVWRVKLLNLWARLQGKPANWRVLRNKGKAVGYYLPCFKQGSGITPDSVLIPRELEDKARQLLRDAT